MVDIREILYKNGFHFKKSLGQNFINDMNLLRSIAEDAGITEEDTVLEIGAGAGSLTSVLCAKAKKVFAFEIDESLKPVLSEVLSEFNNYELVFADILKMSDDEIMRITGEPFKVVANLPYYITTPLIMRFVESGMPVKSLTFMIQKEVAERLSAKENTPEYGAITVSVRLRGDASITRIVDRRAFYPVPNVDSAVITIKLLDKYGKKDDKILLKLIKSAFLMRRKTLVNNLISAFSVTRQEAEGLLSSLGYDVRIRGEVLSVEEFIAVADGLTAVLKD